MQNKNVYYDEKGNAAHYDSDRINSIVKLERVYGTKAVMLFCEMTAEKYRQRIGQKDDPSLEILKINWYKKAANHYFKKLNTESEIIINNDIKFGLPWKEDK
jgi:hypothetical protein